MKTKTSYPDSTTAKTAAIMARYRPIAPKIEAPSDPMFVSSSVPPTIYRQSQAWPHFEDMPKIDSKPERNVMAPSINKRSRSNTEGYFNLPCGVSMPPPPPKINLFSEGFSGGPGKLEEPVIKTNVIAPQPVRPVGSTISIGCIIEDSRYIGAVQVPKKPEEVEEEVELERFPSVVSDSNNKVRLVNSAYSEMIGQPECSWLDSMVNFDQRRCLGGGCRRICGEVTLQFSDPSVQISSNRVFCWVKIEWENNGKKCSVSSFCDAMRLSCKSKDYLFAWRFHTTGI